MWQPTGELAELIDRQAGAVSRRQLMAAGLSPAQAGQPVRSGRWQPLFPGVYATFTGSVTYRTRVHGALLAVGGEAVAGLWTALWLVGLRTRPPDRVQICVPWSYKRVAPRGVDLVQRRDFDEASVHRAARPPRTRVEVTLLDVADRLPAPDAVVGLVLEAVQRRFTAARRLEGELARRPRHRWRSLLTAVLADAGEGIASSLERHYATAVERRHGLPAGLRNHARTDADGRRRYDDVSYPDLGVVVELDGRAAHPVAEAFRDWRRDNAGAVEGRTVLRYGWADVTGRPCHLAGQVAAVLAARGWRGRLRRCPDCP
jgi:hypothetical protein